MVIAPQALEAVLRVARHWRAEILRQQTELDGAIRLRLKRPPDTCP